MTAATPTPIQQFAIGLKGDERGNEQGERNETTHVALIHLKAVNWKVMVQPPARRAALPRPLAVGASQVQTSLGTLPGPLATASQLSGPSGRSICRSGRRRPSRAPAGAQCSDWRRIGGRGRGCALHRAPLLRSDSHQPAHRAVRLWPATLIAIPCGGAARHEPGALSRRQPGDPAARWCRRWPGYPSSRQW